MLPLESGYTDFQLCLSRDLKPENILFDSNDDTSVKVIDFGLARRHSPQEAPMNALVGTPCKFDSDLSICQLYPSETHDFLLHVNPLKTTSHRRCFESTTTRRVTSGPLA